MNEETPPPSPMTGNCRLRTGPTSPSLAAVARQALTGLSTVLRVAQLRPALVNGAAGVVVTVRGRPVTVMGFTIADGKIAEIDAIADPQRVRKITAAVPGEP
jgi:RNA polymerase sigma-70 factor (ECF subfamily)